MTTASAGYGRSGARPAVPLRVGVRVRARTIVAIFLSVVTGAGAGDLSAAAFLLRPAAVRPSPSFVPTTSGTGPTMALSPRLLGASTAASGRTADARSVTLCSLRTWESCSLPNTARRLGSFSTAPLGASSVAASDGGEVSDDDSPSSIHARKLSLLRSSSRLSLAPMMEYTDRHFRHVVRLLSRKTLLYTEMVAANAVAREREDAIARLEKGREESQREYDANYIRRFLGQGSIPPLEEVPSHGGGTVLQLGGSDPRQLHDASLAVLEQSLRPPEAVGGYPCEYTALNLNCGCPSPKVAGKGCFGAALMEDPALVRDCARAMHDGVGGRWPVTVKCRIGTDSSLGLDPFTRDGYDAVDSQREYSRLCDFIETVASDGTVTDFQIHARIAVLTKSFSPADNRKVPPLKYDYVRKLTRDYPELTFSLNGGVETLMHAKEELEQCPSLAGIMIGRGLAADPWGFACADEVLYGDNDGADNEDDDDDDYRPRNRLELLEAYGRHADHEETLKDPIYIRRFITKAISPLFAGETNAKRFRIALDRIGGLPKKLRGGKSGSDKVEWIPGKGLDGQAKVSELILNAAHEHLSEEVLRSTPREGWERRQWEEEKRRGGQRRKIVSMPSSTTGNNPQDAANGNEAKVENAKVTNGGGVADHDSTANGANAEDEDVSAVSEWRRRRDEDRGAAMAEEEVAEAETEANATAV